MRDAGTGFADRRTGLVDTDEQTTLGKLGRYPVKRSSSDSETILKSIDKSDMVDGVESGTEVKGETNSGFTLIYCDEATVECETERSLGGVVAPVCRLIGVEVG